MSDFPLDQLVDNLAGDASYQSTGEFTIDLAQAAEVSSTYQLADNNEACLLLIQAASVMDVAKLELHPQRAQKDGYCSLWVDLSMPVPQLGVGPSVYQALTGSAPPSEKSSQLIWKAIKSLEASPFPFKLSLEDGTGMAFSIKDDGERLQLKTYQRRPGQGGQLKLHAAIYQGQESNAPSTDLARRLQLSPIEARYQDVFVLSWRLRGQGTNRIDGEGSDCPLLGRRIVLAESGQPAMALDLPFLDQRLAVNSHPLLELAGNSESFLCQLVGAGLSQPLLHGKGVCVCTSRPDGLIGLFGRHRYRLPEAELPFKQGSVAVRLMVCIKRRDTSNQLDIYQDGVALQPVCDISLGGNGIWAAIAPSQRVATDVSGLRVVRDDYFQELVAEVRQAVAELSEGLRPVLAADAYARKYLLSKLPG